MSKITLEDVLDFIRNEATHRELDPIADALENEGHSFEWADYLRAVGFEGNLGEQA